MSVFGDYLDESLLLRATNSLMAVDFWVKNEIWQGECHIWVSKKGQLFKGFISKVSGITYYHHSEILKVFDLTRYVFGTC